MATAGAADVGARVALVERRLMGGDCLNSGCVPSKALLASARAAAVIRNPSRWGLPTPAPEPRVDFAAVMARMRQLRGTISEHDSVSRFRQLGVDVFLGAGEFVERGAAVRVGDARVRFRKAVICTGARATIPPIPGLESVGCLTNESLFNLTELPARLAVIGAGPIGCDMEHAFVRFGSEVTLIESGDRVLSRDDRDVAAIVAASLERDGVRFCLNSKVMRVTGDSRCALLELDMGGSPLQAKAEPRTSKV